MNNPLILDCTLRDGGYYNNWNFSPDVTNEYLTAMNEAGVDVVELGLRSLINKGFKGASAYSTENYLSTLELPSTMSYSVMVNASELVGGDSLVSVLTKLFPEPADKSSVSIVRIACHIHEFKEALPASNWLKDRGFIVGYNLMQIADRSQKEVEQLAFEAAKYPVDVLYFADSMGSMGPSQTTQVISWLRKYWKGEMGIHTHDNMGLALTNTLTALENGVSWLDSTVTGMGRGPGNARTEELTIEVSEIRNKPNNMVPLMGSITNYFQPLKKQCGWGSNTYYYLAGKYGIHPTYIQEMLNDTRYTEEDILAAINYLKQVGGKKYSSNALSESRQFFQEFVDGSWSPESLLSGREVLILGAGPGVLDHKIALEGYIKEFKPIVIALNTQSSVDQALINLRVACHPVRLLADCHAHENFSQPLVTPVSMLPDSLKKALKKSELLDFGLRLEAEKFSFDTTSAVIPNSLVISYALAIAASGKANRILLAGFDGYSADDQRTLEMQNIFHAYNKATDIELLSVTPTLYNVPTKSIYAMQVSI
jgi:4-hydroxy 2-oxovalerate aldolase